MLLSASYIWKLRTHSFGVDVAKSGRQKHILLLLSRSSVAKLLQGLNGSDNTILKKTNMDLKKHRKRKVV
jgi:hypothetical protein